MTYDDRVYSYDAGGNVLTDSYRGISATVYGRSAYPYKLTKNSDTISYLYDAGDARLYKKVKATAQTTEEMYIRDALGHDLAIVKFTTVSSTTTTGTEYFVFGTERIARLTSNGSGSTPSKIYNTEATFFLYDHLGNTRVSFRMTGSSTLVPLILQAGDYYPYGKVLREYDNGSGTKYLTTMHERDKETGLDYRGARYYDSDVARFLSLDPLAFQAPSWSAYRYCFDNPIVYLDPDGQFETKREAKKYRNENDINGSIRKENDTYVITDKKSQFQWSKGNEQDRIDGITDEDGIVVTHIISPNQRSSRVNQIEKDNSSTTGIGHLLGPGLIILGQPLTALKPVGALGSKAGSSIASYTLSKLVPQTFTGTLGKKAGQKVVKMVGTNVIGRAAGRFVPGLGWILLGYDVVSFGYDNRKEISLGMDERQRYIDEDLMPLR